MNFTYRNNSGPYVNATNGKAYISITLELSSANISSMQIRNNHVAINLLGTVIGLLVETSNPEKNACEMPIYRIGSILTIL
jgi:hypothetical protein